MATRIDAPAVEGALDIEAVKRYESMSSEEIDAELKQYGIDPAPTITAVNGIVSAKLAELRAANMLKNGR